MAEADLLDVEGRIASPPARQWEPAPAGTHDAVCLDYWSEPQTIIHGRVSNNVCLIWQIAPRDSRGRRFVVSKKFVKRLTPGSGLRTCLEAWRGTPFSKSEQSVVYLEAYVNRPCRLTLGHVPRTSGGVWVHVDRIEPWDWSVRRAPLTPEAYIRRIQRTLRWRR